MKYTMICAVITAFIASSPAMAEMGKAKIKSTTPDSKLMGQVVFEDTDKGVKVSAVIENAPPGDHGFHIHQYGSCDDMGKAAGGHFNPMGKDHGFVKKDGLKKAHVGDMGNISVGKDGKGSLAILIPEISLGSGKYPVAGRAVILHEKPDDFGQPTGNAGGRIGCGTIKIVEK